MHPLTTGSSDGSGGGGGPSSGAVLAIRIAIATADSYASSTALPANAIILRAFIDVVTPYVGETPTISLGTTADGASAFMGTADNTPSIADLYDAPQDTRTKGGPLLVTIGGGPASGAGFACVEYAEPLS